LWGGSNHDSLGIVHLEELWLSEKRVSEFMDSVDLLRVKVQSDDSVGLHKNERIQLLSTRHILEIVLHAHLVENWDVFDHDSFVELVILVSSLLEHKKLIDLLLLHDKVLSRNNSKELLTYRLSHTNNLIWLSGLRLEKLDGDLSVDYESFSVKNENLINFGDKESINGLQVDTHGALKVV
jgi:hypothetical protein